MPVIRQLSPGLINKIAAGEVIERPASVVKELVENSVDAGSRRIDVTLEQGGTELIRVADNGCGIAADQLLLAIASHATSKIQEADDLFHVGTLGFRGEALASIAEISRFSIRSRTEDSLEGAQLEVLGGQVGRVEPCGCGVGTTIEVRDLFFNTPVRRKFLKATTTEVAHATEAFTRIALAYPDRHFVLRHNDRTTYDLAPTSNWRERIATFFGHDLGEALIYVEGCDGDVRISGYVADPTFYRQNNRLQYLFLNGRCIRDRSLQHALSEAYRGLLLTGRFPIAFLRLEMPLELVDVNVHPTKLEVRFQDSGRIYSQLLGAIRRKFLSTDLTARVPAPVSPPASSPPHATPVPLPTHRQQVAAWAQGQSTPPAAPVGSESADPREQFRSTLPSTPSAHGLSTGTPGAGVAPFRPYPSTSRSDLSSFPDASPMRGPAVSSVAEAPAATTLAPLDATVHRADAAHGEESPPPTPHASGLQLHNRYLVTEVEDGIVVIDQHALHERIVYEQLRTKILSGRLETQRLLVPEPVHLTPAEAAAALNARETLAELGIAIEPFGGDTVLVTSYPAMLENLNPAEILRQVVEQLLSGGKRPERRDVLDELLHMISCKAAVKAGDRLTPAEVTALLAQRHLYQDTHHCPHGRPTALVFTNEELDKRFQRI